MMKQIYSKLIKKFTDYDDILKRIIIFFMDIKNYKKRYTKVFKTWKHGLTCNSHEQNL
jgi:hypothetical protein